jgi:hypothetical protein
MKNFHQFPRFEFFVQTIQEFITKSHQLAKLSISASTRKNVSV